jgi:hypothetical protein
VRKNPTNFRLLRSKREEALARVELRSDPKPKLDPALVEAAIAAGRFQRLPPQRNGK